MFLVGQPEWISAINWRLTQFNDKTIPLSLTASACKQSCLQETSFICRSIEHNIVLMSCHLSVDNKDTQPAAYDPFPGYTYHQVDVPCKKLKLVTKHS